MPAAGTQSSNKRPSIRRSCLIWSGLVGLLLAGGTIGWFVREEITAHGNQALRERLQLMSLVEAHQMFSGKDGIGLTFPADKFDSLASFMQRDLGAVVQLPEENKNFPAYRGGRMFPFSDQPAAMLVFARDNKLFSMVIFPPGSTVLPGDTVRTVEKTPVRIMPSEDWGLAMIGPADEADTRAVTDIIR